MAKAYRRSGKLESMKAHAEKLRAEMLRDIDDRRQNKSK